MPKKSFQLYVFLKHQVSLLFRLTCSKKFGFSTANALDAVMLRKWDPISMDWCAKSVPKRRKKVGCTNQYHTCWLLTLTKEHHFLLSEGSTTISNASLCYPSMYLPRLSHLGQIHLVHLRMTGKLRMTHL